jgi:Rrf2 family protein
MQITKQADYALRAVRYLSRLPEGEKASTSAIAIGEKIPPSFLAKIISQLSIAGILHTARGARGGVYLSRSSKDISMLEVIEAIDGPIIFNECTVNPKICEFSKSCALHKVWCETRNDLIHKLRQMKFSQFAIS